MSDLTVTCLLLADRKYRMWRVNIYSSTPLAAGTDLQSSITHTDF